MFLLVGRLQSVCGRSTTITREDIRMSLVVGRGGGWGGGAKMFQKFI